MRISKLLNKKIFIFLLLIFFIDLEARSEDQPVDIWNLEKKKIEENSAQVTTSDVEEKDTTTEIQISKTQTLDQIELIQLEDSVNSKEIQIIGLYDPEDNGLDINMWINSDGDQLKNIFSKVNKMTLSKDASEIMKIAMMTNALYPQKNITNKEFLKFKSDWLIKNADLDLIEEYLIKNQIIDESPELARFFLDYYLSNGEIKKACDLFSKNTKPINEKYLFKYNIYCLIRAGKKNEAQLILDLKKELGFEDLYFEKKIDILFGFSKKEDKSISEKSILDFHLARETIQDFDFEPNEKTDKIIWKYLSSFNLLKSFKEIEISDLEKISKIEKAVHDKNYPEKDLFGIYKRFQFNINQLLNAKESYKLLSNIEGRALLYQKILLESEIIEKLKLLKILKDSFKSDNLDLAFDVELRKFLNKINPTEIPDNLTSFYYTNIIIKKNLEKKVKFNNNVMHQSKLVNYFNGDYAKSKIEKDVNNFLNKIKKDKKYFFSKKDVIFIESLKSDGIEISKKFNDLYEINTSEIPTDIQVMINNNQKGTALLRIVEVIGQDNLDRMDDDTIYFVISTLNQLNINLLRNKILIKVLPLKV